MSRNDSCTIFSPFFRCIVLYLSMWYVPSTGTVPDAQIWKAFTGLCLGLSVSSVSYFCSSRSTDHWADGTWRLQEKYVFMLWSWVWPTYSFGYCSHQIVVGLLPLFGRYCPQEWFYTYGGSWLLRLHRLVRLWAILDGCRCITVHYVSRPGQPDTELLNIFALIAGVSQCGRERHGTEVRPCSAAPRSTTFCLAHGQVQGMSSSTYTIHNWILIVEPLAPCRIYTNRYPSRPTYNIQSTRWQKDL